MLEKMAQEMAEDIECIMMSPTTNMNAPEEIDSLKLLNLLEHIAENAKFYKVVLGSTRTPIFTERLLKILTKSITERTEIDSMLATNDIQRDIAICHGSSALIGKILAWLRKDMPYTPQFLAKQMYMLFHLSEDNRKST
jgi:hypothetical protein